MKLVTAEGRLSVRSPTAKSFPPPGPQMPLKTAISRLTSGVVLNNARRARHEWGRLSAPTPFERRSRV